MATFLSVFLLTGISRDKWHKRRPTGGRQAQLRKKRKFELGRPAANTKVTRRRVWGVNAIDSLSGQGLNYACEASKAGNGISATLWQRRQPLW